MKFLLPALLFLLQIAEIIFMRFIIKNTPPDAPVGLVFIHFFAACNIIVLVLSYFFYFKSRNKTHFWLMPISIAIISILIVIIMQIMMMVGVL